MNGLPFMIQLCSRLLRLFPPGLPGKARLARLVLRKGLGRQNVLVHDNDGCTFYVPSLHEPIAFHLLIDGVYEPMLSQCMFKRLQPGATLVDVGANIGSFTIPMAKWIGPSGYVTAIEASPSVFPYLERNIRINSLTNVCLKQCAASDEEISRKLFYEAPVDHFGMGSMAPQFHNQPTYVATQTLDYMLSAERIGHVDVLKVDVEGAEASVFRGAKHLLARTDPPIVIFEFCDWAEDRMPNYKVGDAQQQLRDWGYTIWRLADFLSGGEPLGEVITIGFEMLVATKI
jgi:FkbM family methyltransferase